MRPGHRWVGTTPDRAARPKYGAPPDSRPTRRTGGQVDGAPEDGDSFYNVVDDDEKQRVSGDDEADRIIED